MQSPISNPQYPTFTLRPMTPADAARLAELDSNFESAVYLDLIKEVGGLDVTWRLIQRPLDPPFVCTDFDFNAHERREIGRRLKAGDGLWLVAEVSPPPAGGIGGGRLVGMVDVERRRWNNSAWVWNIAIDRDYRGRGIGTQLMQQVIEWGRREGLRAIVLETQTNNWSACRFYQKFGFQLSGIDDHYYSNRDVANKEVALFWTYEL